MAVDAVCLKIKIDGGLMNEKKNKKFFIAKSVQVFGCISFKSF